MYTDPIFDETIAHMLIPYNNQYHATYVFYGHLVAQCKVSFNTTDAPAAVSFHHDHYVLHINPEQFTKYTLPQRLFILQHEMHHILFKHIRRKGDRNHTKFNYATDCAINQLGSDVHRPNNAITPSTLPSSQSNIPLLLSAEQYYAYIDEDIDEPEDYLNGCGHDTWETSVGDTALQDAITAEIIEKATAQAVKSKGTLPANLDTILALHRQPTELNWRKLLRHICGNKRVNTKRTFMRQDRRNPDAAYLKGKIKNRAFTLLVVSDVSGSVSDHELLRAWAEILNVTDAVKCDVRLIQVDSEAYMPITLTNKTTALPRMACGGTVLSPAIDKAKEAKIAYNAVVVTTDGEIPTSDVQAYNSLTVPVIWLITPGGSTRVLSKEDKVFKL